MGGSNLDDGAFEDVVFTGRRLGFKGVRFECCGEIFGHVSFFFMSYARGGLLSRFGLSVIPGHSGYVVVGLQRIGGAVGFSFGVAIIATGCVLDQHSLWLTGPANTAGTHGGEAVVLKVLTGVIGVRFCGTLVTSGRILRQS